MLDSSYKIDPDMTPLDESIVSVDYVGELSTEKE